MEFQYFLSKTSKIKAIIEAKNYNGKDFQLKMTPKERLEFDMKLAVNPKKAAILALFYPKNNITHLLLTLRADYKGTHAAQISFPGGKKNKTDSNLIQTALRETTEEVGINPKDVKTIIPLTKVYIPPSNFCVSPYIGISLKQPKFIKNYEVETLIEISLNNLLNSPIYHKDIATSYAKITQAPCFIFNNYIVWGATAMILSEIKEIIKTL